MSTVRSGILFDLDGTLIESAPDLMAALNFALVAAGRPEVSLEAVKGMIGDGISVLVERGFEATGGLPDDQTLAAATARCLAFYEEHPVTNSYVFEGVSNSLAAFVEAGHVLAVCTNKPQRATHLVLEHFSLSHYFDVVVGGDSYPFKKPDPRMLTEAMAAMTLSKERCILVGDSRNDALAAAGAGIPFVMVSFGYNLFPVESLSPAAIIDSFGELGDAICGLLPSLR